MEGKGEEKVMSGFLVLEIGGRNLPSGRRVGMMGSLILSW